jgi:hypothetical protein
LQNALGSRFIGLRNPLARSGTENHWKVFKKSARPSGKNIYNLGSDYRAASPFGPISLRVSKMGYFLGIHFID